MRPDSSSNQDLWISRPTSFNKEREYKTDIGKIHRNIYETF